MDLQFIFTQPHWVYCCFTLLFSFILFIGLYAVLCGHYVTETPKKLCLGSTVPKQDYETLINTFLRGISYQCPTINNGASLISRIQNQFKMDGIPEELIRRLEEEIEAGAVYALVSYSYAPQGVQEAIAVKTALYAAIDNLAKDMRDDLRRYCTELVSGDSHGHPLLRAMTSWSRKYCRLFGNFGGNMIIKSLINYISAGFYELDDTCMRGTQSTSDFTDYFR